VWDQLLYAFVEKGFRRTHQPVLHYVLCLSVTPQTPAGRKYPEVEKQEAMTGQLTAGVRLLQAESRPHAVSRTRALLEQFRLENCEHPVYNLDLAPSEDFLFLHLKKFLAGRSLKSDRQTEDVVQEWLQGSAEIFFDEGIQKLVPYMTCGLM
jgi:hypothetical protein